MYKAGNKLKIDLFGKSHSECIGCYVEGLPKGMLIDTDNIDRCMALRKPSDGIGTPRKEPDEVILAEGVTDNVVTSDRVLVKIMNTNTRSSSYSGFNITPRPGHADLPALIKFENFDITGGAQFSGRMTAPLVAVGAIAQQFLAEKGVKIAAYTKSIYDVVDHEEHTFEEIESSKKFKTRAINEAYNAKMTEAILTASKDEDSVGGIVKCVVTGLPIGFGSIWFDALDVSIARMMFSIPAVKGVEFGKGFDITSMRGSESNDQYSVEGGKIIALSNNMGGVCGGMSDGMPLVFDVAFKPTPSIGKTQKTVNLEKMTEDTLKITGRHDPCIVPRAVSVVEAMTALTIMDQYLMEEDSAKLNE